MSKKSIVIIDGSYGEGGGQILRTSLSLAAITGKALKMTNIRANRKSGGLQPQHLMACLAVREITNGILEGAEVGSSELFFKPQKIQGGEYTFDIKTAGTTILVAQTILPALLFAQHKSHVCIIGGTHLPQSPSYDYFEQVFLPAIGKFGIHPKARLEKSGYYPRGGGEIHLEIEPTSIRGNCDWKCHNQKKAKVRLSKLPRHIGEREEKILQEKGISQIEIIEEEGFSHGNGLTAWSGFNGACALGERGKLAEIVAEELMELLQLETEEVDRHLADQLLLYAALSGEETMYKTSAITLHLTTNAFVIQQFLDRSVEITHDSRIIVKKV